jgi:hypothetical protein
MVTKKRTTGKAKEKLKLKKETIKDLQPGRASVKGGIKQETRFGCSGNCPTVGCVPTSSCPICS